MHRALDRYLQRKESQEADMKRRAEAKNHDSCEYCGAPSKEPLATVSDCDPSVGYHSYLEVCQECEQKLNSRARSRCGICGY